MVEKVSEETNVKLSLKGVVLNPQIMRSIVSFLSLVSSGFAFSDSGTFSYNI